MSMEWHFGSDIDDLAVPKGDEMFSGFPSPDSWSSWGQGVGNLDYPGKVTVSGVEDFLHFRSDVEELVAPHVDQDAGHVFQGWDSCPLDHLDLQLNDIALINEADDIFFRSLFEDATDMDGAETSPQFTQTSSNENMISVSPSGEWNHIQNCAKTAANLGSPQEKFKEPEFGIYVAGEHSNERDDMCNNMSEEESVLMELQRSTLQLTKKIRLCFRDSLYRLAEDSRHYTKCDQQNGREATKKCKRTSKRSSSRLRQSKAKTQGTNAVDRTVAALLFSAQSSPPASYLSAHTLEQETLWDKSDMFQPSSTSYLCSLPGHDAEVPTFGLVNNKLSPDGGHSTRSLTTYLTQV